MSPVPAEVIERPQDLNLPPEMEEVFAHLTHHGAEAFTREIVHALRQAQAKGNLRPVSDVIEAWYRTLRMRQHPDYTDSVRWTREDRPRETFAAEKIVEHYAGI